MGDIKSALEIAMEKVENIGKATDEERLKWKYVPEGEKLAIKYMEKDCNLLAELSRYEEKARKNVTDGIIEVLVRNILLPANDMARKGTQRAMEGIRTIKQDKAAVENVFSGMRKIFDHYGKQGEQQRRQAYESLKADVAEKLQQAVQQQLGPMARVNIDVERQPQFLEEWQRLKAQLDSQYTKLLDEYKHELLSIA